MSLEAISERCFQLIHEGQDYLTIRQHLDQYQLTESERQGLLKLFDGYIQQLDLAKQQRQQFINYMILGVTFFIIGLVLFFISMNSSSNYYILMIGMLVGGYWGFKQGYQGYHLPLHELVPPEESKYVQRKDFLDMIE